MEHEVAKIGYRQHIDVNSKHHSKTICLVDRMLSIFSRGYKREFLPNWKRKINPMLERHPAHALLEGNNI